VKVATAKHRSERTGLARLGGDATTVALGQMSAFVYPLISIPYLSRIFGTNGLGQLLLAMSIVNVVVLVVDFGFGMSALRRVALAETARERSHIVSSTLAAKVLLLAGSASVLAILVLVIPELRAHWQLYFIGAALTIGAAAYPTWLLQGIGKIKTFAALHAVSRLIALVGLLLTVKAGSDGTLAIFWQFAPASIAAVGSWIYLSSIGCHQIDRPTWHAAISALRESAPLFVGSVATIVISAMNTVFLGVFSTIQQVAFYGSGERLSNALRGVLGGVQQSLLPRVSASIGSDHGAALRRTVMTGLVAVYGLAGVALTASAGILVPWYLGHGFDAVIPVAQLLGAALCLTGVSTALTLLLIAHGQAKISSRVLLRAALLHLVVLPLGCINFGAIGAAGAVCVTELFIAILLGCSFRAFERQATITQPGDRTGLSEGES
jgi:PST family polysaccharide transporter